ncbi:MAG: BtpA/SgcQ family protein [Candidatus Kryptoniota bacterium]
MNSALAKVIGVVHLLPLPGSPLFSGSMEEVIARAVSDCHTYVAGGVTSFIIENFGDAPFYPDEVGPVTIAAMTCAVTEIRRTFPNISLGLNVLRNDSLAGMSIASVVGAEFIRVNVHVGAVVTDQGIINSKAYATLRLRKALDSNVRIYCDVDVKHSVRIGNYDIIAQVSDALERGLADAIIISGSRTGEPVDVRQLQRIRNRFHDAKIIVGSGANARNVRALLKIANSVIVGTSVKVDGVTSNPVDAKRLQAFMKSVQ